jgi:UDP-3-O-[3-hydroxymyristoyl] glucosamine N-acyltransferase
MRAKALRLAELAEALGRTWVGDGDRMIEDVAALDTAQARDLSFVRSLDRVKQMAESRAGCLILPEGVDPDGRSAILSCNPALDFARAVERLRPASRPAPGVHATAHVADRAEVDSTASLGPGVSVGDGARVGARTILHANVTLYADVEVGEDCELHSGVVVREATRIGCRVLLQPGVVIGGDGFGYFPDEAGTPTRTPHVGRVVIEDDVEIGANTTVDRATLSETRIRRGAKIDNLVQVGHNCDIGENVLLVAQSGLSGSTVIERGAIIMAQAGSAGHLRIGKGAFVGARAGLHKDVPEGGRVWGAPQMEERRWHRVVAALGRLPDALRRLRAIEVKLGLRPGSATSSTDSAADSTTPSDES